MLPCGHYIGLSEMTWNNYEVQKIEVALPEERKEESRREALSAVFDDHMAMRPERGKGKTKSKKKDSNEISVRFGPSPFSLQTD